MISLLNNSELNFPVSRFNRYSAAASHFGISLAIFSSLLFVLLNYWYPSPFFTSSGGWQGLKIVALVDLVLGPVLTLIVFNPLKSRKSLRADLSIIASLQIAALIWGIFTVYQQRPVAVVFWEDKFYTIPAQDFENQHYDLNLLSRYDDRKPALIYAEKPSTTDGLTQMLHAMMENHRPPFQQTDLYRPIGKHLDEIAKHQIDIHEVISKNELMKEALTELLKEKTTTIEENIYLQLESRYRNIILVLDQQGMVTGHIAAPYKIKS